MDWNIYDLDLETKTKGQNVYYQIERDKERGFDRLGELASQLMNYAGGDSTVKLKIETNLKWMVALYDNATPIVEIINQTEQDKKLGLLKALEAGLRELHGDWPWIHSEEASLQEYVDNTVKLEEHLQKGWSLVKEKWATLPITARSNFVSRVFNQDAGYVHMAGTLEDYVAPVPENILPALREELNKISMTNPFTDKRVENPLRFRDIIEMDWAECSNPDNNKYKTMWQRMLYKVMEALNIQADDLPDTCEDYRQALKDAFSFIAADAEPTSGTVINGLLDTEGRLKVIMGLE